MKKITFLLMFMLLLGSMNTQAQRFAWLTDIHFTKPALGDNYLYEIIDDINSQKFDFVVITGDCVDMGMTQNFVRFKQAMDKIKVPVYVMPGNHETKWGGSGGKKFAQIIGMNRFSFDYQGLRFIGFPTSIVLNNGAELAQVDQLRWVDSVLNAMPKGQKVIALTHIPVKGIHNDYQLAEILRKYNTQMVLAGHIHADRKLTIMGLPVLTSNMVFKKTYPIGTVKENEIVFTKKTVGQEEKEWTSMPLADKDYSKMPPVKQPEYYPVNDAYRNALPRWKYKSAYGIFAAPAYEKGNIVFGDYDGMLRCLNEKDGKLKWELRLKGGILSQPELVNGLVYAGTTDGVLYTVDVRSGKVVWKKDLGGEITGTGTVKAGVLYIASSSPAMYALDAKSGKQLWKSSVMDSVVYVDAKAIVEEGKVMFSAWDGYFYALDQKSGALLWKTDVKGKSSTFYSVRNNRPVYANGNIIFIHPNKVSSIKTSDGSYNWTLNPQDLKIWDGFGISKDKKSLYLRNDKGGMTVYDITGEKPVQRYIASLEEDTKDLCAADIVDDGNTIYFTTSTGIVGAALPKDGSIVWRHKITNSMINSPVVISKSSVVVTGVEGDVVLIDEKSKR